MSKASEALDALYDLMDGYFDNEQLKRKYGITEETAREKRRIIESELEKLGPLEDFEEELEIELIPFLSQLAEAMEQLKKNGLKFKAINFQAKGKKYKLEELE